MANKTLFKTGRQNYVPVADTSNSEGMPAYARSDKEALANYVVLGTLNNTYYVAAEDHLENVMRFCKGVSNEFIGQCAVYARKEGFMKDMPALLCAVLANRGDAGLNVLNKVFPQVIDNSKMLCNFVQIVRSGAVGRKSFGSAVRRLIRNWFAGRDAQTLFNDSIGHANPSLADVIKMIHPKPVNEAQNAIFKYLLGKPVVGQLPANVAQFEAFKKGELKTIPNVPFRALTALPLSTEQWTEIGLKMPWNTLRQNLNTLQRHGVFDNPEVVQRVASKLSKVDANVFPYQVMTTYLYTSSLPVSIRNAVQDALDDSVRNVPKFAGRTVVALDISPSMDVPCTGERRGSTTQITCQQVAALFAAAMLKVNPEAHSYVFDVNARKVDLNSRDSLVTNARKLNLAGIGTACSSVVRKLNEDNWKGDLVVILSDSESWADYAGRDSWGTVGAPALAIEWAKFKARNRNAKLVLFDLQPQPTSQVKNSPDVLHVGGFSDSVWAVMDNFLNTKESFVDVIENYSVDNITV